MGKKRTPEEQEKLFLDKKAGYMGAFSRLFKKFLEEKRSNTKHILPTFYQLTKYCDGIYKKPHQMFVRILKDDETAWKQFFQFADELRPGFLFETRPGNKLIRIPCEIIIKIPKK